MIDGLITNFHLPESTLMMLVSALAGKEHIMAAYEEAVHKNDTDFSPLGMRCLFCKNWDYPFLLHLCYNGHIGGEEGFFITL